MKMQYLDNEASLLESGVRENKVIQTFYAL